MILNHTVSGNGEIIILLHGMAASLHYWDMVVGELGPDYRIIRLDLMGFGDSPKPDDADYDYMSHCQSIIETLDQLGVTEPATLVGHSMGALLAARLAADHPERFKRLVLVAMPVLADLAAAKQVITRSSKLLGLAYYGQSSHLLCALWCRWLRPLSRLMTGFYLPKLPRRVAQDTLKHTWRSYSVSMSQIIERPTAVEDLARVKLPVALLYGDSDQLARPEQLPESLTKQDNMVAKSLPGGHHLPLDQPKAVSDLITLKLK